MFLSVSSLYKVILPLDMHACVQTLYSYSMSGYNDMIA